MNTLDVMDIVNEITINIVKLKIERLKIRNYLLNGGDPKDLEKYLKNENIALDRAF